MKQKCEVYSRVVGYIRPVEQWNDAKASEFKDRKYFMLPVDVKLAVDAFQKDQTKLKVGKK